jgi:hypothetical protein
MDMILGVASEASDLANGVCSPWSVFTNKPGKSQAGQNPKAFPRYNRVHTKAYA